MMENKETLQDVSARPQAAVFPFSFNVKLFLLAVIAFLFYANTLHNGYCLDDGIVITNNQYVQQGFGGIGKIITTDAYDSYLRQTNAGGPILSGGRYRPLSEVVFAIQHALFGESADTSISFQRHLFHVICYVLCILALFYFLANYLLQKLAYGEDMAFFAALLFAIHPIHTEVAANIKSLDEILSLLFISLTFIFSLRYTDSGKKNQRIIALLFFFLALLAKEYAVTLIVFIPLLLYLLRGKTPAQIARESWPYWVVLLVYLDLRYNAVGFNYVPTTEILNNPYALATAAQRSATQLFVLGKYLCMLFIPYPLVCDYSYPQIPYRDFANPAVLLAILVYAGIIAFAILLVIKKNIISFAALFYLVCLAFISNFIVNIGATMGERLIFHASLGFVIMVSWAVFALIKKWDIKRKRVFIFTLSSLLVLVSGYETIARNRDWKDDYALSTHDVQVATNSVLLNGDAGAMYAGSATHTQDYVSQKNKLDTALMYLRKSIALHKGGPYIIGYMNMGGVFLQMQLFDSAAMYWRVVKRACPTYPNLGKCFAALGKLYLTKGVASEQQGDYDGAIQEIRKGLRVAPKNADLLYYLGDAYYNRGIYDSSYFIWHRVLHIDPHYTRAQSGLATLVPVKK